MKLQKNQEYEGKIKENIKHYTEVFEKNKGEYNIFINDILKKVGLNKIVEAQIDLLSLRQILIDSIYDYNIILKKLKNNYNNMYGQYVLQYYNYEYKLSDKHKEMMAENMLLAEKELIDLIDNYIKYMENLIKSVDNILWAIKNQVILIQREMI